MIKYQTWQKELVRSELVFPVNLADIETTSFKSSLMITYYDLQFLRSNNFTTDIKPTFIEDGYI